VIRKEISLPFATLHHRSAAQLVQVSSRFDARIMLEHNSKVINAKSMLGLLSLGTLQGGTIYLVADGADENAAMEAMVALIDTQFAAS